MDLVKLKTELIRKCPRCLGILIKKTYYNKKEEKEETFYYCKDYKCRYAEIM